MEAASSTEPSSHRPFSPGRLEAFFSGHFNLWLAALGITSGAIAAQVSRTSSFIHDDFLNLGEARAKGFSLGYLFEPITGSHIMPVHRFLNWLVIATGGYHFTAVLITSLSLAAAMILLALVVREVGGSASIALLCGALFATSIVVLRVSLWWPEAAGEFPAIALTCASALFALRWDVERSTRNLVLAATLYLLAVFAFDKYLTMVVVILALVVVARPPERSIAFGSVRRRAVECLPLIASLAGLAIAYGVTSLLLGAGGTHGSQSTGFLDYISKMTWSGIAAPLVNTNPTMKGSDAIGLAVLALLALGTIRGSRSAWLWVITLSAIALNMLVLAAGRLESAGLVLVIDPRYQDLTLLTLSMLVPAAWRACGRPHPKAGPAFNLSACAVVILFAVWALRGDSALSVQRQVTQINSAVEFKNTLKKSLAKLTAGNTSIALLDTPGPSFLTGPFIAPPYNLMSNVVRTLSPGTKFSVDRLVADGKFPHPFQVSTDGTAKFIVVGPSSFALVGSPQCVKSTGGPLWVRQNTPVLVPNPVTATFRPLVLAVVLTKPNSKGTVSATAAGPGVKGAKQFMSHRLADYQTGFAAIAPAGTQSMVISAEGGAAFCVSTVSVAPITGLTTQIPR